MSSQNDRENEFQRLEREIQERERAIRLREIEAEINEPPLYKTQKHQPTHNSPPRLSGKLVNIGKFLVLVIAVAVSVKIATSLAMIILVGGVAWIAYKLFFESNHSKR